MFFFHAVKKRQVRVAVVPRNLIAQNSCALESPESLAIDDFMILVRIVGIRAHHHIGVDFLAQLNHGFEDFLTVARKVPDAELEHLQTLRGQVDFLGGIDDLRAQDILRQAGGHGFLGSRKRRVIHLMPLGRPFGHGSAAAPFTIIRVRA
ncbi:hypothetical protein D3C87_1447330 [compost metagenome]